MFKAAIKDLFKKTKKFIKTRPLLKRPRELGTSAFKNPFVLQEVLKTLNNILRIPSMKKELGMSIKLSFTQNTENSNYSSLFRDNRLLIMANICDISKEMVKELRLKQNYKTVFLSQRKFTKFSKLVFGAYKFSEAVLHNEDEVTIDLASGNVTCEVEVDEFEKGICSVCLDTDFWEDEADEYDNGSEADSESPSQRDPSLYGSQFTNLEEKPESGLDAMNVTALDDYVNTDSDEEYSEVQIVDLPSLDEHIEEKSKVSAEKAHAIRLIKHDQYLLKGCEMQLHALCRKCRNRLFGKFQPKYCPECLFQCKAKNISETEIMGNKEKEEFKIISRKSDLHELKVDYMENFVSFVKSYTEDEDFVVVQNPQEKKRSFIF